MQGGTAAEPGQLRWPPWGEAGGGSGGVAEAAVGRGVVAAV